MNKFVLIGPRKGQTVKLVGIDFIDGVGVYSGQSKEDIQAVAYHLGTYYGAYHESVAAEAQAHWEAEQAKARGEEAPAAKAVEVDPPVVKAQDLTPRTPAAPEVDPLLDPKPASLAEALQMLDADKDAHWTSRGLPSVEAIEAVLGKAVTRDEIEAAASGFNRTAAKAAKAV